jgi:hypothetical protein
MCDVSWLDAINFAFNLGTIWGVLWMIADQRRIEKRYEVLLGEMK